MLRIMKDLLVCDMKGHGVGQWLTGTKVSRIARVGAAGNDHADSVALTIAVSGGPEFDMYMPGPVIRRTRLVGANSDVTVADIRASTSGIDVTKDQKKVGVFQAGAKKQFRRHRTDHF